MISIWSLFSATLWFVLAFFLLFLLRGHTGFLMRHGTAAWSVAVILTVVRLLLPLDSKSMIVLRSYTILPMVRRSLHYELPAGVSIEAILIGVWAVGAVAGVVFLCRGIIRDQRQFDSLPVAARTPEVEAAIQSCGIDPDMVCVTPAISTPMAAGFLRPKIYLPDFTYAQADLVWILKHELSHITGRDAWWRLAFLLFRCLFWWNPFAHLAQRSLNDILELRCDRTVLHDLTSAERVAYGEALCHMAERAHDAALSFVSAGNFVQPNRIGTLSLRVQIALDKPKRWDLGAALAIVVSLTLFVVSYVFILQPAGFPSEMEGGVPIYQLSPGSAYLKETPSGDYELWCDGEFAGIVRADKLQDEMFQGLEVLQ